MKVVITGGRDSGIKPGVHTMNSWLHDYFNEGNEVIQLSRETGYDFDKDYDKCVEIARTADIFVNSACVNDYQIRFLNDVYGYVPYLLTIGSIAGEFLEVQQGYDNHPNYVEVKNKLKQRCKWIQLEQMDNQTTKLLHLNITETCDPKYNVIGLEKTDLNKVLDFWFENPIMSNIDMRFFTESYHKEYKRNKVQRIIDHYNDKRS